MRQKGGVHHWVWGFSAVPVIGILAAIAIPQFAAYRSRAYDNQARVAIEQVIGAQQAYRQANPQYADSLEQLRLTGAHLEHRQDLSVAILGAGPEDFYAEAFHPKGTKRFAAGAADPQAFILPVSVQEVFDPEKTYSLKTPEDWRKARDLNDEADLQMAQLVQDCYVIVIAEARADLEGTDLADYAGLARSMIEENLLQVQTNKTGLESINHCAAEQYVIRGTLPQDRLRIVYLHTVILGRDNFFQVLAWTTEQNYPAQEKTLRSIVNTFKEI